MPEDQLFEKQFEAFLRKQKAEANPRRSEMLEKDLTGTKKMFKEALWPFFKSFDGFELEYEIKGPGGVSIFVDVYYKPLKLAFECEGFSVHAETITRSRFDFEKKRVRTMLLKGISYVPFTWDELETKGHLCRAYVQELVAALTSKAQQDLTIYEKEVIRAFVMSQKAFKVKDVCGVIQKKVSYSQKVIKSLMDKGLIAPERPSLKRVHTYVVISTALQYLRY